MRFLLVCVLALSGCRLGGAIANSSPTFIEKHPYQVAIDISEEQACGGALLTQKVAITTKSCFSNAPFLDVYDIRVRVGSQLREEGGEGFGVVELVKHPSMDVALVILDAEVPLRTEVGVISLVDPERGIKQAEVLIMTGYGDMTSHDEDDDDEPLNGLNQQLHVGALRVFDLAMCQSVYVFYDQGKACAGGVDVGMCGKRDVGNPLVNWLGELAGLAIKSTGCGLPGFPTVFADLTGSQVQRWIADNIKQHL